MEESTGQAKSLNQLKTSPGWSAQAVAFVMNALEEPALTLAPGGYDLMAKREILSPTGWVPAIDDSPLNPILPNVKPVLPNVKPVAVITAGAIRADLPEGSLLNKSLLIDPLRPLLALPAIDEYLIEPEII